MIVLIFCLVKNILLKPNHNKKKMIRSCEIFKFACNLDSWLHHKSSYHEQPSPGPRQRVNKYWKSSSLVTLLYWLTHLCNALELFTNSTKDHTASTHSQFWSKKYVVPTVLEIEHRLTGLHLSLARRLLLNCARSEVANYERSFISQINVAVD